MIQIAIISDIHANIVALKEVLLDIRSRPVSQVYCLGDLVDFAPWGNEVINLMKETKIPCLLGNHDERIAFNLPIIPLPHHDRIETSNRTIAINHSKEHITIQNKKWLAALPYNIELTYKIGKATKKILLVHASIQSNDEYIYESDSKSEMLKQLQNRSIHVIVMGHTHHSYLQKSGDALLINCGSVGRSKELDRKATYAILSLTEERIDVEIIKVDYPVQNVASAIYESKIPDFYGDFLMKK